MDTITDQSQLETIPMIVCEAYGGGLEFSENIMEEYDKAVIAKNAVRKSYFAYDLRFDPIMVETIRKMGDKANSRMVTPVIHDVYKKYAKYIRIHDYDGFETISYDIPSYRLGTISEILATNDTAENKLRQIDVVVKEVINV